MLSNQWRQDQKVILTCHTCESKIKS